MIRLFSFILTLILLGLASWSFAQPTSGSSAQVMPMHKAKEVIPTFSETDLRLRLREMPTTMIRPRYNSVVKSYIRKYVVRSRQYTEKMLGRAVLYFPIFEQHLSAAGLPSDLKCLPIVESGLNPNAVSSAYAVGLWQFMSGTAREQGLRVDRYVDQRRDPHKSTEGALMYLQKLYDRYGDWALALAAYNGGPGRVNRAIKRGRSEDFWRIRSYLPRETRNYVPAFIAALYVWNYYHLHNLEPVHPGLELQHTDLVRVYEKITFQEITEVTGLNMEIIKMLNPAFRRSYIPSNNEGYLLTIPKGATAALLNHIQRPDDTREYLVSNPIPAPPDLSVQPALKTKYVSHRHQIKPGETLYGIARKYNCRPEDIMRWNKLESSTIKAYDHVTVYYPELTRHLVTALEKLDPLPVPQVNRRPEIQPKQTQVDQIPEPSLPPSSPWIYHYLKREESLKEVARQYPEVSLEQLLELNDFESRKPRPGDRIRIMKRN